MPKIAPYGTWESPITSDLIVSKVIAIGEVKVDQGNIYWLEIRPQEAGRTVLVRRLANGVIEDLTPEPFNVRSRVHEYGGGAYAVENDVVCFVNFVDQRVYRLMSGADPVPLTPAGQARYADLQIDRHNGRLLAVRESHHDNREPDNVLVSVPLNATGEADSDRVLTAGADFYAFPTLSPDGGRLAWMSWNHPNMPWDGTELWLGELDDAGNVIKTEFVAGGANESIFQPGFSPQGVLHFASDRSGWWNLYRYLGGEIAALCSQRAEFGLPLWQLGTASYRFLGSNRILCRVIDSGVVSLKILDDGTLTPLDTPYSDPGLPEILGDDLVMIGASSTEPATLSIFSPTDSRCRVIKSTMELDLSPAYLSQAQPISFPTSDDEIAHGFYYPPKNGDFAAPEGERPPLIVRSHGGPTSATSAALSLGIQYWTSRGFAVIDVNYRGSTGYGRDYRDKLYGRWGIVDVDDCVNAALFLADNDMVDRERLCIRGGSAGGYTTLSALTFHDVFRAGASFYGIGDLLTLAKDTHKFESRYLDKLIGPLPETEQIYQARSPINFTNRLNCPIIFFQGLDDKVVPPNQAEAMVAVLKEKELPVAYVPFAGEGHGFRKSENIKMALEAELYFYSRVFNFEIGGIAKPIEIFNL
jgi:dienelactone hydrolase